MAGITLKQLNGIAKSLETVFVDDPEQLEAITKSIDGMKASIKKGETVTADDLSDILGEVVIDKALEATVDPQNGGGSGEEPVDPLAPIMKGLFDAIFDDKGQIRKGISTKSAQDLFNKAYDAMLGELDGAIEAATEATAIELGQGGRIEFGKARKTKETTPPGDDNDEDDMEKLLKGLGVPAAVVRKIGDLQGKVDVLQTERDLERFGKQAVEAGEPEAFGAELLKLHKIDPKLAEGIAKRLATKNAALKKARVWGDEIGGGDGQKSGTAYDQLIGKANELIEKGAADPKGAKLTFAKAFTEACNRNPELYQEYRDEQRRRAA